MHWIYIKHDYNKHKTKKFYCPDKVFNICYKTFHYICFLSTACVFNTRNKSILYMTSFKCQVIIFVTKFLIFMTFHDTVWIGSGFSNTNLRLKDDDSVIAFLCVWIKNEIKSLRSLICYLWSRFYFVWSRWQR